MAPKSSKTTVVLKPGQIDNIIHDIRGHRVMLDEDLAELYGVTTGRLNEQRSRNKNRFPDDFAFQLTKAEFEDLKSQFAISSSEHGGRRKLPWVFAGFLLLGMILAFAAWLIREQFSSSTEMLQLVISFSAIANIGAYLSIHVIEKLFHNKTTGGDRFHEVLSVTFGSLIGSIMFLAAL